jgi:hypothetical protein
MGRGFRVHRRVHQAATGDEEAGGTEDTTSRAGARVARDDAPRTRPGRVPALNTEEAAAAMVTSQTAAVRVEDPVGLAEIAERLQVATVTVNQWRTRGVLPAPKVTLAMGPLWSWSTIERWARDTGRL